MSLQIILLDSVTHMFYNFFNVNEKSVCKSFLKPSFLSEFSEECLTNLVYSFYYQVVSQFVSNFWHPWIVNSTECNTFFYRLTIWNHKYWRRNEIEYNLTEKCFLIIIPPPPYKDRIYTYFINNFRYER